MCPESQPISAAYTAHLNWLNPDRPGKRRKPNIEAAESSVPVPGATQGSIEQPPFEEIATTISPNDVDPTDTLVEASEAAIPPDGHKPSAYVPGLTHSQLRKRRRKGQIERTTSKPKTQIELDSERQLRGWREEIMSGRKTKEQQPVDTIEATNEKEDFEKNERERLEHTGTTQTGQAVSEDMGRHEGDLGQCRPQRITNGTMPAVNSHFVDVKQRARPESISETPGPSLTEPPPKSNIAFYLHHPSLPSRHPVLIPLSPTETLATALTNRLVLEFPTIYVLHQHLDQNLPEGFISEKDFFDKAKKGLIEELEEGEVRIGDDGETQKAEEGNYGDGKVDERRLLEVLGKDLNGIAGAL